VANPQKENGYTPIAHTILEALATHVISPDEWRVLMVILRKTYGWDKKEDLISNSQFAKITGISRNHIPRILKKLISRNIIYRVSPIQGTGVPHSGDGSIITYGFQKDFDKWRRCPPNRGLSPDQDKGVPHSGPRVSPKQGHTKETLTKETIQKKAYSEFFLNFWDQYPNKKGKEEAFKAWKKHAPNMEVVIKAVIAQKEEKASLTLEGKFCPEWPNASTWLNNKRWEDEIQEVPKLKIEGDYPRAEDQLRKQGFGEDYFKVGESWKDK